jgi:hypothetical protein
VESDSQPGEEFFLRPRCPSRLTVAPVWLVAAYTQPDFEAHRPLASICMPEYEYVHGTLVVEWATMVEFPVAPCSDRFWDFSNSPFFRYLGCAPDSDGKTEYLPLFDVEDRHACTFTTPYPVCLRHGEV